MLFLPNFLFFSGGFCRVPFHFSVPVCKSTFLFYFYRFFSKYVVLLIHSLQELLFPVEFLGSVIGSLTRLCMVYLALLTHAHVIFCDSNSWSMPK